MTVAETIQYKVDHMPPRAQEEVLDAIEEIEIRYRNGSNPTKNEGRYILDILADIKIDGPSDLADRHDYYASGKLEE